MVVTRGGSLHQLPQVRRLPAEIQREIRVVAKVLPFKVNNFVLEKLIDWSAVPDDPIYRLLFPHREMLASDEFEAIARLVDRDAPDEEIRAAADRIRGRLNPHPGGQLELNVPTLDGRPLPGLQHKYRETVLVFPAPGQTCHAYCGYCFRWAQFVGDPDLRQANRDIDSMVEYIERHPEVTDVLLTGGDPMIMSTGHLRRYIEPLLSHRHEHVRNLRIGTKVLTYWPQRFVSDPDADDFLRLIEKAVRHGKHVALMAHLCHERELQTNAGERAIRRLRDAGAVLRTQAPLVRHVNDQPEVWATMWRRQVQLGLVPYYFFVARDTGAQRYFGVPLAEAFRIYSEAWRSVSGLARTVRGPSMSATPGKVVVDGTPTIAGERVFALRFLQARDPSWVGRPFFARFDAAARWLDDLRPAFGERRFFFE